MLHADFGSEICLSLSRQISGQFTFEIYTLCSIFIPRNIHFVHTIIYNAFVTLLIASNNAVLKYLKVYMM